MCRRCDRRFWSLLTGAPCIRQYHVLNDRRYVLTKDSNDCIALYDILSACKVKDFGNVSMEAEVKKLSQTVFVPNWFTIDLKIGVSEGSAMR